MSWLYGVLVGIDQLGNAAAWGNPDVTVSARVGHNAKKIEGSTRYYWLLMEMIINFAFYPVDGPDHCYQTYLGDADELHKQGSDIARALLGLFIIVACVPISLITRIYILVFPGAHYTKKMAQSM